VRGVPDLVQACLLSTNRNLDALGFVEAPQWLPRRFAVKPPRRTSKRPSPRHRRCAETPSFKSNLYSKFGTYECNPVFVSDILLHVIIEMLLAVKKIPDTPGNSSESAPTLSFPLLFASNLVTVLALELTDLCLRLECLTE
jgi:hypothetical protein